MTPRTWRRLLALTAASAAVAAVLAFVPQWMVEVAAAGRGLSHEQRSALIAASRALVAVLVLATVVVDRYLTWRERVSARR